MKLSVDEKRAALGCKGHFAGHFVHEDMAACPGSWTGHIKTAQLCAMGWHVCSSKDKAIFDQMSSINDVKSHRGCFAMNAVHQLKGDSKCSDCINDASRDVVITGVGMNCPRYSKGDHSTCVQASRVDVSVSHPERGHRTCDFFKPVMTGVVCCRDEPHRHSKKVTERE